MQPYELRNVLFVIYVANFPHGDEAKEIEWWLKSKYPTEIDQGLFEVIEAPSIYYPPDLDHIKPTFNDSIERMRWRTKQNLGSVHFWCKIIGKRFRLCLPNDLCPNFTLKF